MRPGVMIETSDQLARYLQRNIPQPSAIKKAQIDEENDSVRFEWHEKELIVLRSLRVLERRGQHALVTEGSLLVETVLLDAYESEKAVKALVNSIHQAEDLILAEEQIGPALKLLDEIKKTLRSLARPSGARHLTDSVIEVELAQSAELPSVSLGLRP